MKRINENIAYAKAILNKSGISSESEEYKDYLRIRELCDRNHGYVGILTKIRFVDGVTDMDEIESIFNLLKNSKIDVNKINKLTYDDILDMFYSELSKDKDKDIELIFKDDQYSYFRVYTYEGILKIGSPSWCLKTKSNWDHYQSKYPDQWVIVDNRYLKSIITPNNNYLENYKNINKPWIRYGLSTKLNEDGSISWVGNDDNNGGVGYNPRSWTEFGVLTTIFNLCRGIKKSYYEHFLGCENIGNGWHKVINLKSFVSRFNKGGEIPVDSDDQLYVLFSKTYSYIPVILVLNNHHIKIIYPTDKLNYNDSHVFNKTANIKVGGNAMRIILDYISDKDDIYFDGIKLANGLITLEDIKSNSRFLKKVGKWLIFNRNKKYYLIVNSELGDFEIPTHTKVKYNCEMNNPMAWYLNKETFRPESNSNVRVRDFHREVMDAIESERLGMKPKVEPSVEKPKEDTNKKVGVGGFWDFFRGRK